MSTAQVLFSIALVLVTVIITAFGVYVAGSTLWGNRWFRSRATLASKPERKR